MDEWKDILSPNHEKLTDEELLKYLHDDLSEDEKNKLEKKATGAFENDALDGLKHIKERAVLEHHLQQLNQKLPTILRQKKYRAEKKRLKELQWLILTIVILLFVCIIAYLVIRMHNAAPTTPTTPATFGWHPKASNNDVHYVKN
jgi:hypothetical protein